MPRKPKAKNTMSAGERAKIYEAEQAERRARMQSAEENNGSVEADRTDMPEKEEQKKTEKPKAELKKPQFATVKVDLSMPIGAVKPMHGICNGPVSYGADISSLFKEIGVPIVRFADTDSAISAYAVDISRIYKDISRDPRDPSSYDFTYTDKYIAAAYNAGAKVIFRLGESYDRMHSGKSSSLPVDIDTFVEVCANIVRHYNDYFANGFAYGIEYFELLGDISAYSDRKERVFEFYRRVASALKLVDRDLKVGGPCLSEPSDIRELLRFCRRTRAPLDFLTLSVFDSDPHKAAENLRETIPLLHNLGFSETEIIIGSWSFIDREALGLMSFERAIVGTDQKAAETRRALFGSMSSVKGAAYALAFMLSLGKIREVSAACFYDAQPMLSPFCAICDRFGNPEKPFYAFKAYGTLFRAGRELYSVCEEQSGFAHSGIYALAAEGDAAKYILLTSFDGCGTVDLRLDGIPHDAYTAEIYMLDGVKDMSLADSIPLSGDKKRLILNISRYGAAMVKIY